LLGESKLANPNEQATTKMEIISIDDFWLAAPDNRLAFQRNAYQMDVSAK
jgi:hypothetical protein